ncbi:AsmA family protein [Thalassobacter stenotrophicus]|uniref:AsmA protein n=2 Tax=Thalassobacter stenotrophicus TaxID=266809 RepID=A0ABY1IBN5_9RHOB|nr:AsmA family protein [Thalassobacter stenotrophicus]CUH59186.1 putative assembly protein [Thalassobacter stenotrophicus]SHI95677.1 AsmA protein [Thalassobacter stenotrophicus DSM 16310]
MRWIKRLAIGVLALVALAVGALFIVPTERIARLATDQFEQATGRALTINGSVRPAVFPSLGVRIEDVAMANADWSAQGPMLAAARLDVSVGLMDLLGGAVSVDRLELVDPVVLLERAADGRVNWDVAPRTTSPSGATTTGGSSTTLPEISLAEARIINGTVAFIDAQADALHRVEALDLTMTLPSLQGRAEASGSALYNGAAVTFDGALDGMAGLLSGDLTPIEAQVAVGGTTASVTGSFGMSPLGFEVQLTAQSTERATLFAAIGQAAPDLPSGFGRDQITLQTGLTLATEGSLHLRDMTLGLDGNSLRGDVDVFPSEQRPKIVATLDSPGLDLSALAAQSGGEAGPSAAPTTSSGWSTAPIDVSALGLADAEIVLTTGAIGLGDATLDAVSARLVLDRARAVITLAPIRAYGGSITGEVIVNGRGGLSSRVNLTLSGLQTQPLLTEFLDFERLLGQADVSVNVLGVGTSMAALMSSLEGSGNVSVGRGEILGLDLAGMMRNFDLNFQGEGARTIFDGITGQFSLTQGVLNTDDLTLSAPLLEALTQGQVNMGAQNLDLTVVPVLLQNAEGAGISVPLRITGPWSAPRIRPDLEAATLQQLNIDGAAIEDNARFALQQKLAEELDVAPEGVTDGQSIEDAVKDRVEDKVRDALGGLFGGN